MILSLEFGPRDEILSWANEVVLSHSGTRVIAVTHSYLNWDDTRAAKGDEHNPHQFGFVQRFGGNDGEEMWDKFVKLHPNIFLVLSGHILDDGVGRLTSIGADGNKVYQPLANYQQEPNGGGGWLRIMQFVPNEDKIYVTTYSPYLNKFKTDSQNQFELRYEMSEAPTID